MRYIEKDSLTNQDIHADLLIGSYTADAARGIFIRLFADQITGGGDYKAYATLTRVGGSAILLSSKTTLSVEAAVTSLSVTTDVIPMKTGEILRVYLLGLPADTTTVDTDVEFWEDNSDTLGNGAITWVYNVKDNLGGNLADVTVWVTSDLGGSVLLASGTTDASGNVTFYLDAGTVYVWCQKSGYNFTNPDTEVVS